MATEIERKYLIHSHLWKNVSSHEVLNIRQAYIVADNDVTLRVRISDNNAYLTLKGKSNSISRQEFEYEIPLSDGEELMSMAISGKIEKKRHIIYYEGKKWEVDEFLGNNKGLIVAEIELGCEDEIFQKPEWIDKEVTVDPRFRNTYLAKKPFETW